MFLMSYLIIKVYKHYKQAFKIHIHIMLSFHRRLFNDDPHNSPQSLSSTEQYNKAVLKHLLKTSPVSLIMVTLVVLMFILCEITDLVNGKVNLSVISHNTLLKYGANYNAAVNHGEVYRIFTAMFLHSGVLHILANMSSFFLFLMPVQSRTRSRVLYTGVLLCGGMLGNILSLNVYNLRGKYLFAVGSSTAICSVIGFDFAYRILRVNSTRPLQTRRLLISLSYIFLISIMPGVDFFGHFGGIIGGFLIGSAFLRGSQDYWGQSGRNKLAIGGAICLIAYAAIMLGILIKFQFTTI